LIGVGALVFFVGLREFIVNKNRFRELVQKEKEIGDPKLV